MEVVVNGQSREVPDGLTVEQLVAHCQMDSRTVLVEHNQVALHRSEWTQSVRPGDQVEFIRIVAGG